MKLELGRTQLTMALHGVLSERISIVDHLPDSVTPPCVLVAWADPWLKPSTLCAYEAAMEIMIVAQRIEPGGKLVTLEEIVCAILPTIKGLPMYQTVDVTAPYPVNIAGVDYLAATINLTYDVEDD